MEVQQFLMEVQLGDDPGISNMFNYSLAQVYSPSFLKKIEDFIDKKVDIEEIEENNNVASWSIGTKIIINKPIFFKSSKVDQMKYLLHEFAHILQSHKIFSVRSTFPEILNIGTNLDKIIKENLIKDISVFFTGKKQNMPTKDKFEILAYFMNGKIDWSALKPKGRLLIRQELNKSGLFNLGTNFWKKRL